MGSHERNHALPDLVRPWLYCISDGSGWQGFDRLIAAARAGVDFIQIREKQLSARELLTFCRKLRAAVPPGGARLLVNERVDVALAAALDGVHCPAAGVPAQRLRPIVPSGFLIAQSCHSVAEVGAAEAADFCVFGPVFATPSKAAYGRPLGLEALFAATQCGRPVLALGGVETANVVQCLARGAVGVAGIRMFAGENCVTDLRVLLQRRNL
ncbi:MAG: thiamine phosphate synthase [Terriglobales bacterium]